MRSRPTLAQRVSAARRRAFVGRHSEQELFRQAVEAPGEPPFTVLHVHGPGGIGKSALLRMFGELAEEAGALVVRLDGRELAADRDAVRAAAEPAGTSQRRAVLLVDTYELLAPLDGWLREELLPGLQADVVAVLAGRLPPGPGWTEDPGWRELVRVLPLAPLSAQESAGYLASAPIPPGERERVLAFCSGYPLALALSRELAASGDRVPERLTAPDAVEALMSRLVDAAPSGEHRRALQICAWARTTTETLLRQVLGRDDVTELFDWLRAKPYVEIGPRGVYPHDVVRDVLVADLRWRDAESAAAVHKAVRQNLLARIRAATGPGRERAILDFLFNLRHDPVARAFYDWDTFGTLVAEPVLASDREDLEELLVLRAGPQGARPLLRWLDAQPAAFAVCREGGAVRGVAIWLSLHDAPDAEVRADPVTAAVWAWAQRRGLRPGQDVVIMRYLVDRHADQGRSPAFEAASVQHIRQIVSRPDLAFDFSVTTDPGYLGPFFTLLGYERVNELDVVLDGRLYAVFAHDWRSGEVPARWRNVALRGDRTPDPAFVDAVRAALRDLARPDLLDRSPLIGRGVAGSGEALRARLVEAVQDLHGHPRDEKLFRAVDRTYLRPAATQELAAEVLDVPFSTYRRHLTQGVSRVAGTLWAAPGRK